MLTLRNLSCPNIELTEIVVRIVTAWLERDSLLELLFGKIELSPAGQIRGIVCSGSSRVGLQPHSSLKMLARLCVLRLRRVDQSQKLVDVKAFRHLPQ